MKHERLDSLSILIPAYNDEQTIEAVVSKALSVGQRLSRSLEVIVANDTSRDGTRKILDGLLKKHTSLRVINHEQNQGYGGTIRELYYEGKNEWLFTVPGDFQIDPEEVMTLARHVHEADMILGLRVDRNDPPSRLRQSLLYNGLLRILFDLELRDVNSVRLIRKSMIQSITLATRSAFVDAELAIRADRGGYRVLEVPIRHKQREGSTGGGGSWGTIWPTILDMVQFWVKTV